MRQHLFTSCHKALLTVEFITEFIICIPMQRNVNMYLWKMYQVMFITSTYSHSKGTLWTRTKFVCKLFM